MTSVTNSSGLNYQNGINPLGRKVRALESDVDMLKKEVTLLKGGSTGAGQQKSVDLPPTLLAEFESMKKELATMKAAGYGKGDRGDKGERGDKGDKGDKGDTGPMTYIAMPPQMMATGPSSLPIAATVLG